MIRGIAFFALFFVGWMVAAVAIGLSELAGIGQKEHY